MKKLCMGGWTYQWMGNGQANRLAKKAAGEYAIEVEFLKEVLAKRDLAKQFLVYTGKATCVWPEKVGKLDICLTKKG